MEANLSIKDPLLCSFILSRRTLRQDEALRIHIVKGDARLRSTRKVEWVASASTMRVLTLDMIPVTILRTRTSTSQTASHLRSSSQLACRRSQGACAQAPEYLLAGDRRWCRKHARFPGKLSDARDRSRRSGCAGMVLVRKEGCFLAIGRVKLAI